MYGSQIDSQKQIFSDLKQVFRGPETTFFEPEAVFRGPEAVFFFKIKCTVPIIFKNLASFLNKYYILNYLNERVRNGGSESLLIFSRYILIPTVSYRGRPKGDQLYNYISIWDFSYVRTLPTAAMLH